MSKISSFSKDELIEKLEGVIFPNPEKLNENGIPVYETADEYLSGNVRTKLAIDVYKRQHYILVQKVMLKKLMNLILVYG